MGIRVAKSAIPIHSLIDRSTIPSKKPVNLLQHYRP
nr:MAG TPA: hypothetical protein [Caudoviricetes sp.]